jgi:hypothetical protein
MKMRIAAIVCRDIDQPSPDVYYLFMDGYLKTEAVAGSADGHAKKQNTAMNAKAVSGMGR